MAIDWNSVQENAGGNYKNFYADGDYTVKCDGVEIKEVGDKGSVIMKFHFEETNEAQYPTADHWLSFKNDNWRIWHNKCLMEVLGATEDNAKKAVEVCESKEGKANKMKAYESAFKKLTAKKPEVGIEVYTEGNYARAEFKDRRVAMPHDNEPAKEDKGGDLLSMGEEASEDIDLSDMPF